VTNSTFRGVSLDIFFLKGEKLVISNRYFMRDNILNATGELAYLSEREIEVLGQLNTADSSKIIAENLNISTHTLNQHLRNIYSKLATHSRMGAVLVAQKNNFYKTF